MSELNEKTTVAEEKQVVEHAEEGVESDADIESYVANPWLSNLLKGKLESLVGSPSEYIKNLPTEVKSRLHGLLALQEEHTEIETRFHREILELEKKYEGFYAPLYKKRYEIIQGTAEPTSEQIERGKALEEEEEEEPLESRIEEEESEDEKAKDKKEPETPEPVKGVPSFWLTALYAHPRIRDLITERDAEAMEALKDIRIEYQESAPGFKLIFEFGSNPFFTNTELTKTYYYTHSEVSGCLVFESSQGCEINWKAGRDLTVTIESKKQRHKTTNKTRIVKKTVPADTFFWYFDTIAIPDEEDDSEEAEEMRQRLETDYELGEEFKEKIVPHAINWFTGKALEYDSFEEDDEYDDDEYTEDEDEDDDEDDDEESDGDVSPGAARRPPRHSSARDAAAANNCKQQ